MNCYQAMQACIAMRGQGIRRNFKIDPDSEFRFVKGDFVRPVWDAKHKDIEEQRWVFDSDGSPMDKLPLTMEVAESICADDWVVVK